MTLRISFGIGLIALTALAPAALAASAASEPSAPAASSRASLLVIVNKSEDTVSWVNLETLQPEGRASIGRGPTRWW